MSPEQRKKVLLITYYWPPAGGSGVQRALKFAKYLREFGWEPVIFTVANGEYPEIDTSLALDLPHDLREIKAPTLEPYSLFRKFTANKYKVDANLFHIRKKKSTWTKLLFWVRSNFFIPDARMMWIIPSHIKLYPILRKEKFDAIISTGPPHTAHLIGARLSKKFNIPWLADFRDPWTSIDYFETLSLTPLALKIHQRMERRILTSAHTVVTVSPFIKKELERVSGREVQVITNGFDEENFPDTHSALDAKFTIIHMGMLNGARNHAIFWQALEILVREDEAFRLALEVHLYGKIDDVVVASIPPALADNVFIEAYVKHTEVPAILQRSNLLYLSVHACSIDMGVMPGKLFEYLASKRPILCIGPPLGDTANIIRSMNAGETSGYTQLTVALNYIRERFQAYQRKEKFSSSPNLKQFSRRSLTSDLAEKLNKMAGAR